MSGWRFHDRNAIGDVDAPALLMDAAVVDDVLAGAGYSHSRQ
jgi:hypothetical protein